MTPSAALGQRRLTRTLRAATIVACASRGSRRNIRGPASECGYTWQVPRWAKQRRFRSLRMFSDMWVTTNSGETAKSTDLNRQVESIAAQNQQTQAFRNCPECGADHFTQGKDRPGR